MTQRQYLFRLIPLDAMLTTNWASASDGVELQGRSSFLTAGTELLYVAISPGTPKN